MSEDTGSMFKVPLTTVTKVENHPNADRLDVCTVYGFQVVTQKGKFNVGDKVLYVPIDSVLSPELEARLFPADSKIKLNKSRVRQIRIRKYVSQGMLIDPLEVQIWVDPEYTSLEEDCASRLGITKYEPPFKDPGNPPGTRKLRNKPTENPFFRKFNGVTNIKWMPHRFQDEEVVIQEKIHGTHVRFGRAPFVANTLWKKLRKFFGFTPKYEFVYGSNNVELTNKTGTTGYYGEDVYGKCLHNNGVLDKVKDGEFIHGEIYGPGIQQGYDYGVKEHKLIIFDVRVMNADGTQKWLNPEEAEAYAKERGFDFVPVIYKGMFSEELLKKETSGPSVLCPAEKIREGVVVKSRYKYDIEQNKQALKSINPEYLDNPENTDFH